MIHSSLEKAHSRLRIASKALDELEACADYNDFMDVWYTFLVAYKNVFTSLEKAVKGNANHMQWFGRKNTLRRKDPLLQYLYQARSDDEHGVEKGHELAPGRVAIGVSRPGETLAVHIEQVTISNGVVRVKNARNFDGTPTRVEVRGPHARLIAVTDRAGKKYDPPIAHLGQSLPDLEPLTVAKAGSEYVAGMVKEAEERA